MSRKRTIRELEFRKHILEERKDKDNMNIIHKIERQIKKYNM